MAGAAELLERESGIAYWDFAETQFLDVPPEVETYGRSLSSIRRLGAFMIDKTLEESILSPEADQAKVEFYTSVEEGFGTDMELGGGLEVRDFDMRPVMDGRVMSKDLSRSVSSMTEAGLACAVETAKGDRRFLPQLTRSKWDHHNAVIVDEMTQGKTDYNTRIVTSPFPEEASAQSGDEYWRNIGYVPHLRRGFVQLYYVGKDGVLAGSLSFDGSDKARLREVFAEFGVEIPEGEVTDNWLKYAITGNISEDKAKMIAIAIADKSGARRYKKDANTVDVTKQFRPLMERAFNESYIHVCESLFRGRQTENARQLVIQLANKAHHFNERYASALYAMRANPDQFTNDDSVVLHELLVYSTIEMMRALHLKETDLYHQPMGTESNDTEWVAAQLQAASDLSFQDILSGAGANGAKHNRTYSACGLSISLGGNGFDNDPLHPKNEEEESPQAAFGGQDRYLVTDEDKLGNRVFTCPKGHVNYRRRANVKERNCATCRVDISCETPGSRKKEEVTKVLSQVLMNASKADETVSKPKKRELATASV
jgi:hypothetical protein